MGQNQVFVPQCHSTNSLAAELMRKMDFSEGTLFITDHQTAGRGQRGNSWEAEPRKNLTFSLLLKPSFLPATEQFYLTIAVSLALHEFLTSRLGNEVKIKWPNDILVNDKKICGILIENTLTGDAIQHCIVGIGLNVNQASFSIPSPTSMRLVAHQEFDLAAELSSILEQIEASYLHLRSGQNHSLKQEYLDRLYWLGVRHQFRSEGRVFNGVITGVGENGNLNVLHDGQEISFNLKEISFVS